MLDERGVLRKASYLSAVSGGAYIATSYAVVGAFSDRAALQGQRIYEPSSPEEQHLRNRTSYVAPNFKGMLNLVITLVGGIAINVGLVALGTFLAARALAWFYLAPIRVGGSDAIDYSGLGPHGSLDQVYGQPDIHATHLISTTIAILVAVTLGLFVWQLIRPQKEAVRTFVVAWTRRVALLAFFVFVVFVAIPNAIVWIREHLPYLLRGVLPGTVEGVLHIQNASNAATPNHSSMPIQVLTAILGVTWVAAGIRSLFLKHVSKVAMLAGSVFVPLFVIGLFMNFLNGSLILGIHGRQPSTIYHHPVAQWVFWLAVFWLVYLFADLTNWSGHPFYKRRLSSAFVT